MMVILFCTFLSLLVIRINSAPLARCMVDMTYTFDDHTLHWPGIKEFKLDVIMNGSQRIGEEEVWLQSEEYSSSTHVGTHMDAPAHFAKGGLTIDQIPVGNLIAPAAVVDITDKVESDPEAEMSVEDLLLWETTTGQSLDGTILLLRTGWGKHWGDQTAHNGNHGNSTQLNFPGMAKEACQWLVDHRHINGVGTEALSFDKGATRTFPCHTILLGHGLFGLENVAHMDQLPLYGAKLYVMPMKIAQASGAPTRIVATYPQVIFKKL